MYEQDIKRYKSKLSTAQKFKNTLLEDLEKVNNRIIGLVVSLREFEEKQKEIDNEH